MKSKNITIKTLRLFLSEKKILRGFIQFYIKVHDEIEITHSAKNRDTFARGAIMSAEWLVGKKGFYTFNDCLKNENKSFQKNYYSSRFLL